MSSFFAPPLLRLPVIPNTTLKQDGMTLLRLWKGWGKDEEKLRQGKGNDVSNWKGIGVCSGRVIGVIWAGCGLSGTIPREIAQLSALTYLSLWDNSLSGKLPPEFGSLSALNELFLHHNALSGLPPPTLSNLVNLQTLSLWGNNFTSTLCFPQYSILRDADLVQAYLATLRPL